MRGDVRWWWVRHAPVQGMPGIIHGSDDVEADLSNQAALTRLVSGLPQTALWYVSGLIRAQQTANAICNGTAPIIVPEFNEQNFGDWNGLSWDQVPQDDADQFWRDSVYNETPNGESFGQMAERVQSKIHQINTAAPEGDIIAIAHAGPIRAALGLAFDGDIAQTLAFELDNLSTTCIVASANDCQTHWRIRSVNG